jgi:1-deoxy-D-xylulose-5-phosphate reductoisomerase
MTVGLTVLGSTGSVGRNTLDVVARHPGRYRLFALTASSRDALLGEQCLAFKPCYAVMADAEAAVRLTSFLKHHNSPTKVLTGEAELDWVAAHDEVDVVMAAIVGAAGLRSSYAAALAGKRLLLANKEALVVGGDVFMKAVRSGGATLLPIDSEHSAIFQALPVDRSQWAHQIEKIILTASGGPFRTQDPLALSTITPEQACAHPNWVMGQKISVDSATMMNKALEVIEAHYLFDLRPKQIDVVIHPQSVIHSMVQFVDQSVMAQLGTPDMRVPIAYGLSWPDRIESGAQALDFRRMQALTFESIDGHGHPERFPALRLAWDCLAAAPGTCVVLNAANEVAVQAFLARQIRYDAIYRVISGVLEKTPVSHCDSIDALLDLDLQARQMANQFVGSL